MNLFFNKNNRALKKVRNIHEGKRAFIVANGPSLRMEDLDRLKGEITFASNKIYLAFEKTEWRPTYLTVIDQLVAEQNKEALAGITSIPRYFGHATRGAMEGVSGVVFGNTPSEPYDAFEWDVVKGVRTGHSVLLWDLILAHWMGIRTVYAIGLDFHFDVPETATGEKAMGNAVLLGQGESNHFDSRYRPVGEKWTMPKLDCQREEFKSALMKYEQDGGYIYNASRQTKLEVWPCVDFDALF